MQWCVMLKNINQELAGNHRIHSDTCLDILLKRELSLNYNQCASTCTPQGIGSLHQLIDRILIKMRLDL